MRPARFLRRPVVEDRTGLSRSAIYALMARGEFPAAIPLTARAVGWEESAIDAWIAARIAAADNETEALIHRAKRASQSVGGAQEDAATRQQAKRASDPAKAKRLAATTPTSE